MTKNESYIFWGSLLGKLLIALMVPLVSDEYYYWLWGQNLQWSYFDHPPAVGWIMAFGDLFKSLSPEAMRWPFVLISHGTLFLWMKISEPLLSTPQRLWLMALLILNPLVGWGGLLATPDVPLLFFWSLSALSLLKLYKDPSLRNYSFLGMALGLGFLSKYMIVIFIPCLLAWVLWEKLYRYVWTPKIFATLFWGLLFCAPVLIWNLQNDWASFSFQWKHGTGTATKSLMWPLQYGLGQFFLLFPIFFIGLFRQLRNFKWLTLFGFGPLVFFLITSFFSRVEANWPVMAYPAFYILALLSVPKKFQPWVKIPVVIWSSALVLVLTSSFWLSKDKQREYRLKTFEAEKFREILELAPMKWSVFAPNYQIASFLGFYRQEFVCKIPKVGRPDFFTFDGRCESFPQRFLFVAEKGPQPDLSRLYPQLKIQSVFREGQNFVLYEVVKK